ncbi:hypothetical protein CEXT_210221 [Caerostris extrusa]|uniref:Uncharacterized protein n=1 Tax=Caerostris extrusa TaxID=172846 RepID=A0AAV4XLJ2_CAEEX|nr:hypothetical protein CEXT_210221 [Caerostris extrusa]
METGSFSILKPCNNKEVFSPCSVIRCGLCICRSLGNSNLINNFFPYHFLTTPRFFYRSFLQRVECLLSQGKRGIPSGLLPKAVSAIGCLRGFEKGPPLVVVHSE